MNPKPGVFFNKANGKENLINYIQLAVKARESKIPFIVFDKKTGKYAGATSMGLIRILKPYN
jgi:hypothetical protein